MEEVLGLRTALNRVVNNNCAQGELLLYHFSDAKKVIEKIYTYAYMYTYELS